MGLRRRSLTGHYRRFVCNIVCSPRATTPTIARGAPLKLIRILQIRPLGQPFDPGRASLTGAVTAMVERDAAQVTEMSYGKMLRRSGRPAAAYA